jgi:DNA-binding XRE family transcriptional regulator
MLKMERELFLTQLDTMAAELQPDALKLEARALAHKLRFPMTDILAQVPGETLSDRARAIGVSRQTMYVWASERFRPTPTQARSIAKLTSIPIEHLLDDGFERHDPPRPTKPKAEKLAGRRKKSATRKPRVVAKRGRKDAPKMRKRTRG